MWIHLPLPAIHPGSYNMFFTQVDPCYLFPLPLGTLPNKALNSQKELLSLGADWQFRPKDKTHNKNTAAVLVTTRSALGSPQESHPL